MAELSYQLLGYAAYLVPLVLVVIGWHYFWCRALDAAYTKLIGAALLFGCVSAFLSLAFGTLDVVGQDVSRRRVRRRLGGGDALPTYLNRTGSIILILTLLFLAIILSTQFSFGRLFAALGQLLRDRWAAALGACRERREERRRDKQRQEVLKKHLDKAPAKARRTRAEANRRSRDAGDTPSRHDRPPVDGREAPTSERRGRGAAKPSRPPRWSEPPPPRSRRHRRKPTPTPRRSSGPRRRSSRRCH